MRTLSARLESHSRSIRMDSGLTIEKMEILVDKLKGATEHLEVDAHAHKEADEKQESKLAEYGETLLKLSEDLNSLIQVLKQGSQAERRSVLRDAVPLVVVSIAAHCGRHYWTSSVTRQQAHTVLTLLLQACGCGSVLELLIGRLPAGHTPTSPYLPVAYTSEIPDTEIPDFGSEIVKDTGRLDSGGSGGLNHGVVQCKGTASVNMTDKTGLEQRLTAVSDETNSIPDSDVIFERGTISSCQSTATGRGVNFSRLVDTHPACHPTDQLEGDVGAHPTSELGGGERDLQDESKEEGKKELLEFTGGLLKPILSILRAKLTRDTWKTHPTAKHALVWCLKHLKHPHVGLHLDSFLPPILMLLDDHETYHKVLGLSAVTHVLKNVDPTELRWYGRADVIYEAIKSFLYMGEPELINALHPCMARLLPVVEGPRVRTVHGPRKPAKTDEVFSILLNSLDFESKLAVRKAYTAHLQSYINLLGIYTVRHLKRLLSVLYSCLEFPDYSGEQTRKYALQALTAVISNAWPRVPYHKEDILRALLKLMSDLCPSNEEIPEKTEVAVQLTLVTECFVLLARCCDDLQVCYKSLQTSCSHKTLSMCLEDCLGQLTQ